jgi:hypothetical protein
VPAVPSCLLEPIWVEFRALLGAERPPFDPGHPLGCHRRRVSDRVVFEHVVAALVHGSGYERIATAGCSDRTIRRLKDWAGRGIGQQVHALALAAYDQIIGLELADVAVDGCMTKAPCGGPLAGPSPVDRRKGGLKRSVATEGYGIPLGIAAAGANRHDSPLLAPTLHAAISQLGGPLPGQPACHLDAAYQGTPTQHTLTELGFAVQIARLGIPAPIQATKRWPTGRQGGGRGDALGGPVREQVPRPGSGRPRLRRPGQPRRLLLVTALILALLLSRAAVRRLLQSPRQPADRPG